MSNEIMINKKSIRGKRVKYSEVEQAINNLISNGDKPSIRAIKTFIGHGSLNKIGEFKRDVINQTKCLDKIQLEDKIKCLEKDKRQLEDNIINLKTQIEELKHKQVVNDSNDNMERACDLYKADMNLSMPKIAKLLNNENRKTRLNKEYCGNNLAVEMIKWLGNNPDKAKNDFSDLLLKLASSRTKKNIIVKNGLSELFIELGGNLD